MPELRRSSEARQVELVDAALHLIATRGIAALTTRALAEHVGLSSGAIFRHFASLDSLLEAVVARVESVLDATYPPMELTPRARLERFIAARSAAVAEQIGIFRLMLSEQFVLALPRDGSRRLAACREKTRTFLRDTLAEGQRAGELRADLGADELAVVVMGTVQMLAMATAPPGARGARPAPTAAPAVREALLALLAPAPGPRAPPRRPPPRARARSQET